MNRVAVDTSALLALTFAEDSAHEVQEILTHSDERHISAATVVELGIVVASRTAGRVTASEVLTAARLRVEPLEEQDALVAIEAWQRFGKGRQPAGLNLGDCYSYALARRLRIPLLAVGQDFRRTDLAVLP